MTTYTITNIDYSGNDFCGEISGPDAAAIFDAQPTSITITHDELYNDIYEEVIDFCYDNAILEPTSFVINGVKCDGFDQVFIQNILPIQ